MTGNWPGNSRENCTCSSQYRGGLAPAHQRPSTLARLYPLSPTVSFRCLWPSTHPFTNASNELSQRSRDRIPYRLHSSWTPDTASSLAFPHAYFISWPPKTRQYRHTFPEWVFHDPTSLILLNLDAYFVEQPPLEAIKATTREEMKMKSGTGTSSW